MKLSTDTDQNCTRRSNKFRSSLGLVQTSLTDSILSRQFNKIRCRSKQFQLNFVDLVPSRGRNQEITIGVNYDVLALSGPLHNFSVMVEITVRVNCVHLPLLGGNYASLITIPPKWTLRTNKFDRPPSETEKEEFRVARNWLNIYHC